jgi:hypothetical protein
MSASAPSSCAPEEINEFNQNGRNAPTHLPGVLSGGFKGPGALVGGIVDTDTNLIAFADDQADRPLNNKHLSLHTQKSASGADRVFSAHETRSSFMLTRLSRTPVAEATGPMVSLVKEII